MLSGFFVARGLVPEWSAVALDLAARPGGDLLHQTVPIRRWPSFALGPQHIRNTCPSHGTRAPPARID